MSLPPHLWFIVYTGCVLYGHVTADVVLGSFHATYEYDEDISCEFYNITRNYASCDGIYEPTGEICTYEGGISGLSYIKNDTESVRYFYKLRTFKWAVATEPCQELTIGETIARTDKPWTTNFNVDNSTVTSIDCPSYKRSVKSIPDQLLTLPPSPQQGYVYKLQFDDQLNNINLTAYSNFPADWTTERDSQSNFNGISVNVQEDQTGVHGKRRFNIRYPEGYTEQRLFRITVKNQNGYDMEAVNITLSFLDDDEETSETTTASIEAETTDFTEIYISESPDTTDEHDEATDIDVTTVGNHTMEESRSTMIKVESSSEIPAIDPCLGISCDHGAICSMGVCECRDISFCEGGSDVQEVCAEGRTFLSICHLEIEICKAQKDFDFKPGPCQGAVTEEEESLFAKHRALIITIIVLLVLIILTVIILFIVCCWRKRKTRSMSVTSPNYKYQPQKKPARTPSSTSDNQRASPKPKHYMTIEEEKPQSQNIDPDRFSLTGCITPLIEESPSQPFGTFKPDEPVSSLQTSEPKPDGDSGIEEIDRPSDVMDGPKSDVENEPVAKLRENPPQRNTSTTENSVYEIRPEANASFNLEVVDNAFEDDAHVTTTV